MMPKYRLTMICEHSDPPWRSRWSWQRALLFGLLGGLPGCTIAETTAIPSEEVVVVEAVLRTDLPAQYVLLHRSLMGRSIRGVPGAEVTVLGDSGRAERFTEVDTPGCLTDTRDLLPVDSIQASCYRSAGTRWWVNPGQRYQLEIRLPEGGVIRGQTRVAGGFSMLQGAWTDGRAPHAEECWIPPSTRLELRWTPSAGAWSYVAPARVRGLTGRLQAMGIPSDLPEPFDMAGLAVSSADTSIVFPTEFGLFERFQYDPRALAAIQDGLPAGTDADVVVAATERNYVNGVRGGRFNPSGQIRISSVVGDGVGVFGALVPLHFRVLVRDGAPAGVPRCNEDP